MGGHVFDVRDFGAVGDGRAKDTAALQAAVDVCAGAGGGQVVVSPGRYVTGTLCLKSHVELHLSAGARIVGSPDRADYNAEDAVAGDAPTTVDRASAAHLIIADRVEDVSITGPGVIDGNSGAFLGAEPDGAAPDGYRFKVANRPILGWRTGQSVVFFGCRRVSIRDVAIVDAPYWTVYVFGCVDVQIRGVTITNPPTTPNGDGIDIVSCQNVTVSDCLIRTGDDCLVLRTRAIDDPSLPVSSPVCENVVITNCVLSTTCNAIRVGVADGVVRRCLVSNIVVSESRTAVDVTARYSPRVAHGTCVEDLHFADFVVDACIPFLLTVGEGASRPAAIRDVSFSQFHITASAGAQIAGSAAVPIERIRLSDIDWTLRGGTRNLELVDNLPAEPQKSGYHGQAGAPALPCALYGVHLIDAELDRIRFRWDDPSPVWQVGIITRDSPGVEQRCISGDEVVRMKP
jgi:hypothetical protein